VLSIAHLSAKVKFDFYKPEKNNALVNAMEMQKRENLSKEILKEFLIAGGVMIASTSPYFLTRFLPKLVKHVSYKSSNRKKKNRKFTNAFYYLKNRGLIKIKNRKGQIYISLTEEGKKRAGKYQIDELKIKKSRRWDKKWRVLIFDIQDKHKIKREALRGKIKELGLYQLQKSVWVYPYKFQKEIGLLRDFFGLNNDEMKVITAAEIEDDYIIRKFYGFSK